MENTNTHEHKYGREGGRQWWSDNDVIINKRVENAPNKRVNNEMQKSWYKQTVAAI